MPEKTKKLPKAVRISRRLPLSSERLVVLSGGEAARPKCTLINSRCLPHTC